MEIRQITRGVDIVRKTETKGPVEKIEMEIVPKDTFTNTISVNDIKPNYEVEQVRKLAELAPDTRRDKIAEAVNRLKAGNLTDQEMEQIADVLIRKMF